MSTRFKFILVIAIIAVFGLLVTILVDIKNTYVELGSVKTELVQVKSEFSQYQTLVQKVNEIDHKFTQELTDAKSENDKQYNNVINNIASLQLNNSKPNQTGSAGMDDANACELTGEARQNYYLLRDDIITKDNQVLGLQSYIKNVCLVEQ
ncbi:prophage endopeptidase [Orbus hercynius]|uniref:Prophage endopeptidase n=1 Tax=Orbus hercynius TaxID=593135 RepID=A0A495RJH2_9GAMM|nr:lysis protein [Orbus hercynius]RKS87316.1 prophage endopeptidase [Orbus hercynius]